MLRKTKKIVRSFLFRCKLSFRKITAPIRFKPDIIIVGTQKGGTSSLFKYLGNHPDIVTSFTKEVHFFDNQYTKGMGHYRAYFPIKGFWNKNKKAMEASPYYMVHPHAIKRIHQHLPDTKIILLLRNPVDRAYSHYNHEKRYGREGLSIVDAIKSEDKRCKVEWERLVKDETYYSYNIHRFSYLLRGRYVEQIENIYKYFSKDQVLILESGAFFKEPERIYLQVLDFVGVKQYRLSKYEEFNTNNYKQLPDDTRQMLSKYFRNYNEMLYKLINNTFNWD